MENIKVLSVGGSIVAPDKVDVNFIKNFKQAVLDYLNEDLNRKLVFVVGGGGLARSYQKAYREIVEQPVYLRGTYILDLEAPIPGVPWRTLLFVIANSPSK